MVRKVVTVDDGLHLPAAVQTQLKADLDAEFADYVTDAQTAASDASLSVVVAESARDEAEVARDAAVAAAALASAPTDTMVASLITNPSDTRTAADDRYAPRLVSGALAVRAGDLFLNVRDFGALGNDTGDDAPAIQAAINAAQTAGRGTVYIPPGVYRLGAALTITGSIRVFGAGRYSTVLKATTANLTVIDIAYTAYYATVQSMSLTRSVTATSGYGIRVAPTNAIAWCELADLHIVGHANGLRLGPSTFSHAHHIVIESCTGDGVFLTNSPQSGVLQWQLDQILVQACTGSGFRVFAQATGPTAITMGEWRNLSTFGNSGNGVRVEGGPACAVTGVRINTGFFGADGGSELFFSAYGGYHLLTQIFAEYAGTAPTGIGLATPATNSGHGLEVASNTTEMAVVGGAYRDNSDCGIWTAAQKAQFSGVWLRNNGLSATVGAGFNSGLFVQAGRVNADITSAGQQWGATLSVTTVRLAGDLNGNSTAAVGGSTPAVANYIS